jgi:hypothetical protein
MQALAYTVSEKGRPAYPLAGVPEIAECEEEIIKMCD